VPESDTGLFSMKISLQPERPPHGSLKVFLLLFFLSTAACTPPPESLSLQCITGAAEWTPILLDLAHPSVGGSPAMVTDGEIRWESISRNGFGGATHTQYGIDRASGIVTVESVYWDPRGNKAIEPGRYTGECYVRHRSL
jgi:hypothetical protein